MYRVSVEILHDVPLRCEEIEELLTEMGKCEPLKEEFDKHLEKIQQIIDEIQKHHEWLGVDWAEESDSENEVSSASPKKTVRLLDYACGTGLVSRVSPSSSIQ